MRRILLFSLALIASLYAFAISDAGWYKYPIYADDISDIVEASNKVYFLSGSSLFSFSTEDNELFAYTSINRLSGTEISSIHYNYDKKYLLIVYSDSNMDALYDNGKVVNLPEIRDAKQISASKTINDVAFGNDCIAVGTSFGLVVYDDEKMEVKESGIYNQSVLNIAIMNDYLLIFYRDAESKSYYVAFSTLSGRHNTFDKFTNLFSIYLDSMVPVSDTRLLARSRSSQYLMVFDIDFAKGKVDKTYHKDIILNKYMRQYRDGYYSYNDTSLILYKDGELQQTALSEALCNQVIGLRESDVIWVGNSDGLACYNVGSSSPAVLYDKMKPQDVTTVAKVGLMQWSADGERLYIMNVGASQYRSWLASHEINEEYQQANIICDGFIQDVSLKEATVKSNSANKYQTNNGNKRMYGDPVSIVEDPDDPDKYYCAANWEGVYVVKYNDQSGEYEEKGNYIYENAPFYHSNAASRTECVTIDPAGNLWVGHLGGYCYLPAAKRQLDPSAISESDWVVAEKINEKVPIHKDMAVLFCQKSNMAFFYSAKYEGGFLAVDTKGTYSDLSDDNVMLWTSFVDQDGQLFDIPERVTRMVEDERGCVWVGTSSGLFELTTPSAATSTTMTVRRIKVPRNDGTNYADYLLDSDFIYWIACDPSDRKWIATENSGLFLVSETGDEILANYTSDNSPLASNVVGCVECDKNTNTVYAGTPAGLYSFLSDSAPASDSYDDIIVYPNPVRANYGSEVTISGLMDNSIVKIADASGRVIYQTRSEGGMAAWPVTNQAGKAVKTGVYYIFVSSYNNDTSAGSVAKVMVIN